MNRVEQLIPRHIHSYVKMYWKVASGFKSEGGSGQFCRVCFKRKPKQKRKRTK